MLARVFIGLGSNIGDRVRHITEAVAELSALGAPLAASLLYETAPLGGLEQDPYINAVATFNTHYEACDVLAVCIDIERSHGRERRERWCSRTLDLDLLLYGDKVINEPGLTVPHPRLAERRFVLEPLLEVDPEAMLPGGRRIAPLLAGVSDQEIRKVGVLPDRYPVRSSDPFRH